MSCNSVLIIDPVTQTAEFQSLSGFLMSCNKAQKRAFTLIGFKFQSLSGFLMSCNYFTPIQYKIVYYTVSIPIGFSNEL